MAVGGKVTFAAADDTLAEMLVARCLLMTTDIANVNEVVHSSKLSGDTYIFSEGATTAGTRMTKLIELRLVLTGMTTLTESTVTAGDFTIA